MLSAAVLCLALNIYHEARDQPLAGRLAVAYVTVNRARQRGMSICATVKEPHQFSWVKQRPAQPHGYHWRMSIKLARKVLKMKSIPPMHFFHHVRVHPPWRRSKIYVATIGAHVFYAEPVAPLKPFAIAALTTGGNRGTN